LNQDKDFALIELNNMLTFAGSSTVSGLCSPLKGCLSICILPYSPGCYETQSIPTMGAMEQRKEDKEELHVACFILAMCSAHPDIREAVDT